VKEKAIYPYPFHQLTKQQEDEEAEIRQENNQSYFGNKNPMTSVPKTLGNVLSNEWRDLLKFIAVSKGSTKMPQGLDQINTRPANLPEKSEKEKQRTQQLLEENRKQYI
jgi:hypothetical protein